jgi:hypothetical protein
VAKLFKKIAMKFFYALSMVFAVSTSVTMAGGFGGPAPFQNGSPLRSGIDGIYQASASGQNLTGIISFALNSGIQTSNRRENSWIMFHQGTVYRGSTAVNVVDSDISGILDSQDFSVPSAPDGTIELPVVFIVPSDRVSGEFTGSLQLRSPTGKFSGKGSLYPSPSETLEIIGITADIPALAITSGGGGPITIPALAITKETLLISGSTAPELSFRFNGVRKSTVTGVTAAGNSQQSN